MYTKRSKTTHNIGYTKTRYRIRDVFEWFAAPLLAFRPARSRQTKKGNYEEMFSLGLIADSDSAFCRRPAGSSTGEGLAGYLYPSFLRRRPTRSQPAV